MNNAPLDAERSSAIESTPETETSRNESKYSELSPSAPGETDQGPVPDSQPEQTDKTLPEENRDNSMDKDPVVQEPAPSSEPRPSSLASRCFSCLSFAGPLVLLVLWAIQAVPNLLGREPRALHELTASLQTLYLGAEPWLAEQLASHPISDMMPVYNWFLKGLSLIPGLDQLLSSIPGVIPAGAASISLYPELLPLGTALASLFLVLLTWCLARSTGSDRKTAFASGLVLLAGLAWMGLPCLAGDELLGAALMTLTSICLYRGWCKSFAPLWLLCGFALVAVSTLALGLPGLVFPLLTSLFFLIWRGTFRRGGARDGAIAFGVMLILLCAWGTLVAFSDGGRELLRTELEAQFLAPILYGWELQGRDSWIIFATLALLWLPWTLLVLFLPWECLHRFLRRIGSNRRERPGQGWLWCSLLIGLIVYALLGAVSPLLLPPLLPPLAILTAQGLLSMGERRSRAFFLVLAVILALTGLLHAAAIIYPLVGPLPPVLAALQTSSLPLAKAVIPVIGFLLFAFLLWKVVDRSRADGALLIFTILALLLAVPMALLTEEIPTSQLPQPSVETPAVPDSPAPDVSAVPETSEDPVPDPAATGIVPAQDNTQQSESLPVPSEKQLPAPETAGTPSPSEEPLPLEETQPFPAPEKPVPEDAAQSPQSSSEGSLQ